MGSFPETTIDPKIHLVHVSLKFSDNRLICKYINCHLHWKCHDFMWGIKTVL